MVAEIVSVCHSITLSLSQGQGFESKQFYLQCSIYWALLVEMLLTRTCACAGIVHLRMRSNSVVDAVVGLI